MVDKKQGDIHKNSQQMQREDNSLLNETNCNLFFGRVNFPKFIEHQVGLSPNVNDQNFDSENLV